MIRRATIWPNGSQQRQNTVQAKSPSRGALQFWRPRDKMCSVKQHQQSKQQKGQQKQNNASNKTKEGPPCHSPQPKPFKEIKHSKGSVRWGPSGPISPRTFQNTHKGKNTKQNKSPPQKTVESQDWNKEGPPVEKQWAPKSFRKHAVWGQHGHIQRVGVGNGQRCARNSLVWTHYVLNRSFDKRLADRGGWREEILPVPEIQASFLHIYLSFEQVKQEIRNFSQDEALRLPTCSVQRCQGRLHRTRYFLPDEKSNNTELGHNGNIGLATILTSRRELLDKL